MKKVAFFIVGFISIVLVMDMNAFIGQFSRATQVVFKRMYSAKKSHDFEKSILKDTIKCARDLNALMGKKQSKDSQLLQQKHERLQRLCNLFFEVSEEIQKRTK